MKTSLDHLPAGKRKELDFVVETLREVLSSSVGMAAYTASTLASLVEQTVTYAVTSSVNAALDRLVPAVADAVLRDVRANLETSIVTPFDREDIQALANALDDVLDEMRAAADTALQHRISAPLA